MFSQHPLSLRLAPSQAARRILRSAPEKTSQPAQRRCGKERGIQMKRKSVKSGRALGRRGSRCGSCLLAAHPGRRGDQRLHCHRPARLTLGDGQLGRQHPVASDGRPHLRPERHRQEDQCQGRRPGEGRRRAGRAGYRRPGAAAAQRAGEPQECPGSVGPDQEPEYRAGYRQRPGELESAQAAYDKVAAGASRPICPQRRRRWPARRRLRCRREVGCARSTARWSSAAATFEKARIAVQQAQGALRQGVLARRCGRTAEAATLQSATIDYNSAKAAYEALAATSKSDANSKVASAAASLRSAQASLAKLKNQVTTADLTAAKATLTQAQNDLETLLAGSDANTLDIGPERRGDGADRARPGQAQAAAGAGRGAFRRHRHRHQRQDRPDRQRHRHPRRPGSPGNRRQHGRGGCEQGQGGPAGRGHARRGHRCDAYGHGLADRPGRRAEQRRRQLPRHHRVDQDHATRSRPA